MSNMGELKQKWEAQRKKILEESDGSWGDMLDCAADFFFAELQSRPVGDVEEYLKQLENKEGDHPIDFSYWVNEWQLVDVFNALKEDCDRSQEAFRKEQASTILRQYADFYKEMNAARFENRKLTAEVERLKEQLRLANIDAVNNEAEVDRLMGGWISVEERVPKVNQLVLGTYVHDIHDTEDAWICAVEYKGKKYRKHKWCNQFVDDDEVMVTHWQPLPLPPNPQP